MDEYIEYYNYKRIKSRYKSKSHTVYFKEKLCLCLISQISG
ncbi:IS3 family transposase [uncultured Bacteroides sp.]